jgi:hypothetical protein
VAFPQQEQAQELELAALLCPSPLVPKPQELLTVLLDGVEVMMEVGYAPSPGILKPPPLCQYGSSRSSRVRFIASQENILFY